jgi:hypothetical protein
MSINLGQLKTERDQAESKMASAIQDASRAKERFIVDIYTYDEWQAKKTVSSAAIAEFGKANAAYRKARWQTRSREQDQPSDREQSVPKASRNRIESTVGGDLVSCSGLEGRRPSRKFRRLRFCLSPFPALEKNDRDE